MAAKSILEADGKAILNYHLTRAPVIKPSPLPKSSTHNPPPKLASLFFPEDAEVSDILDQAEVSYPWLLAPGAKFVAKPDQLIKRRGKSGLLALNKTWPEAKAWIAARARKPQQVETVMGVLSQFLVEPFVPHPDGTEYYININSQREVCLTFHCVFLLRREKMRHREIRDLLETLRRMFQYVLCVQANTKSKCFLDSMQMWAETAFCSFGSKYRYGMCYGRAEARVYLRRWPTYQCQIPIASSVQFRTCIGKSFRAPLSKCSGVLFLISIRPSLLLSSNKTPIFYLPRANHVSSVRATGFFSHTKVVSTLVTSMLRPRRSLSQLTFPNIHRTKRSLQHS